MRVEGRASIVAKNWAMHNMKDGVKVDGPTATLSRNTANANGELGILAATGLTDGGGNRARQR
jgi:hypothetical protein